MSLLAVAQGRLSCMCYWIRASLLALVDRSLCVCVSRSRLGWQKPLVCALVVLIFTHSASCHMPRNKTIPKTRTQKTTPVPNHTTWLILVAQSAPHVMKELLPTRSHRYIETAPSANCRNLWRCCMDFLRFCVFWMRCCESTQAVDVDCLIVFVLVLEVPGAT